MPPLFDITVDASGPIRLCEELASGARLEPIKLAVGRAALRVQADVRASLQAMVYDLPEGRYKRTGTLMRTSHAAKPGIDHSGDEAAGLAGKDFLATDPLKVVGGALPEGFASEIGNWIHYAVFVHEGTVRMASRPFLAGPAAVARAYFEEELARAVRDITVAAQK